MEHGGLVGTKEMDGSLVVPEGYRGVEVFDSAGRVVFRKALDESGIGWILQAPSIKGTGPLRIRLFR